MDVVNVILKPVVESLMVPVKKHLDFVTSCTKYVRDMGNIMRELNATKVDVENHMKRNKGSNLVIPAHVTGWLEEVEKINAEVDSISGNVGSCCNFMTRRELGGKAFKIIQAINLLIIENSRIEWTNHPVPLGRVDSRRASTSTTPSDHNDFESREQTFTEALKALQPNHKSHMVALCGMGGVGKSTMMEKLKNVVKKKKMFSFIVEVVIGEKTKPVAIQDAVADYLGIDLKERTKPARADKLRKWFDENSGGGKNKILIILDDVWELVDLNDIGLSPFPNQGVDFKVLLTSRNREVCTTMGVEANSIFNVKVLAKAEAQSFFWNFIKYSNEADLDLNFHQVGNDIVGRCQGLPIAIKTIANTLKGKSKDVWEDALTRLKHHDIDEIVGQVFELSYNNLKNETKSVLLLCGLFPEDFDIPTENLVRYGWGLKLFNKVYTIRQARYRLNTCIEQLMHTNLLIESHRVGCIKMHDLVRAFVLEIFSKAEHATIVNHGDMSEWPTSDKYCKIISLTCKGMSTFPADFKFPNLSLLKLTHGDRSLQFPENMFGEMEKLQVIAYERMDYPLLPKSFQCSTNLRTLCLHQCLLMSDFSSIGDCLNLEVLSFAHCQIQILPSTIGYLKKLKLLDLTGCVNLQIDSGVLKNLVKLEELYMGVHKNKAIRFTNDNCNELAECSNNLSALEIEFFKNSAKPMMMSFDKLEKFKMSIGCFFKEKDQTMLSFGNVLKLVTNRGELLESGMNKLFEKTKVLQLKVDGMNNLEDIEVKSLHPPQSYVFCNIRVLVVSECAELSHLFTHGVATAFPMLEHLEISSCPIMEALIHIETISAETIKFPKLKFLSLCKLSNLLNLCNTYNIIELPQLMELRLDGLPKFTSVYPENKPATSSNISAVRPFLHEEVVAPNLEMLKISSMKTLKQIWPCEISTSEDEVNNNITMLREIEVENCVCLVNLFPRNPMKLLNHLEELKVKRCGSIQVLFNIDMDCVCEIQEVSSSRLRNIEVSRLGSLTEMWSIKGANNSNIRVFQSVEIITIEECKMFKNVFTPTTTTNFDIKALTNVITTDHGKGGRNSKETLAIPKETKFEVRNNISNNVAFPSYLMHSFHHLVNLSLRNCKGVEAVFEIESLSREFSIAHNTQQPLVFPSLEKLKLYHMEMMSHVWKCSNWNEFLILQRQQPESSFQNLTTIELRKCKSIKYLFSPLMVKLLFNLKKVDISSCDGIEEVVSYTDDKDGEMTPSTTLLPRLDNLNLIKLANLKRIGGAKARSNDNNTTTSGVTYDHNKFSHLSVVSWSLCQYAKNIYIRRCDALSSVIPLYALGQMQKLEVLRIRHCESLMETFETQGINNNGFSSRTKIDEENDGTVTLPTPKHIHVLKLPNLKILEIEDCDLLEHIFTFSMLKSLRKLKELKIKNCKAMKVIVKEENGEETTPHEVIVFPCLKSLELVNLPNLLSFFVGKHDFQWPLLDDVIIVACPHMMMYTSGQLTLRASSPRYWINKIKPVDYEAESR